MSYFPHIESLKVQLVQPSALVTIRYNLPPVLYRGSSWNKNTAHSAYAFRMPQKVDSGVGGLWSHGAPQLVSTPLPIVGSRSLSEQPWQDCPERLP